MLNIKLCNHIGCSRAYEESLTIPDSEWNGECGICNFQTPRILIGRCKLCSDILNQCYVCGMKLKQPIKSRFMTFISKIFNIG